MTTKEEQKKVDDKSTDMAELHRILMKYYPDNSDSEDLVEDLGYGCCSDCTVLKLDMPQCNVCSEYYCEECAPEHSNDETGL